MEEADAAAVAARPGPARPRRIDLRWTKRRKRRFLTRLAETYDMDEACAAAGLDWAVMCRLRAGDPAFAAEWAAVIEAGYDRIEALLLRRAGAAGPPEENAKAGDAALARELLKQRAARKAGDGAALRSAPRRPNRDQAIASILGKLTALPGRAPKAKDGQDGAAGVAGMARPDRGPPPG